MVSKSVWSFEPRRSESSINWSSAKARKEPLRRRHHESSVVIASVKGRPSARARYRASEALSEVLVQHVGVSADSGFSKLPKGDLAPEQVEQSVPVRNVLLEGRHEEALQNSL